MVPVPGVYNWHFHPISGKDENFLKGVTESTGRKKACNCTRKLTGTPAKAPVAEGVTTIP